MNQEQLEHLRHSLAHLLAAAVAKLWPEAKRTIGPAVDNGFYYDFDFPEPISEDDLPKIEKEMKKIIKDWQEFERFEVSVEEAKKEFKGNPYKLELIDEFSEEGKTLTIYQSGDFRDLCRGGHTEKMDKLDPDSFKLDKLAGAYWRGDENNKMLTRIYGLAFATKKELNDYLKMIEEAKKRDHRKLGKELDLFTFSELVGSGLPLYTPRGSFIRKAINDYVESLQTQHEYTQIWTPQIAKGSLFKTSGHYDKYKDSMFRVVSNYSEEEFFLKPMNCPQHTQVYLSQPRSYRDLPLRYTDFAMLYRDEKPGELNGLARVRSFSQDDCHIFCTEEQVDQEIDVALNMTKDILKTFGLTYRYRLSTRDPEHPEKYLGDPKIWDKVEAWAEKIMKRNKIEYFPGPGEAAFYAPKMDLIAKDALGREWQLSTVQIDFVMPERFGLEYTDKDGQKKRPVMLHRAIVGSPERFIMILIEHFAGAFPLWLSPTQIKILNISSDHEKHCLKLAQEFKEQNIRVEADLSNETVGNKIRKAASEKIPYILVIGDREMKSKKLMVRVRGQEKLLEIDKQKFVEKIKDLTGNRSLEL
ncbi:MAG: threonine--tRNA ligase [Candidatus Komeilibacteria bacterium CG10_big_fil_rev_8_21_14_0_10_41_13]|uniref:Threonine--tRNA ligase n=1 Tax=Candidatus Komeilibacteria bacterium CG10_big_fil_rev_8_21_14_0_10_41_13 TaxID=1974476 RepID=A0A2M6WCA1_9BACT|nr:MAG: threonine--tRNA ligase [Candidatus Komeilibacteria bacterium CG10_big_fil_rev_8_21_14_0_10_41_13]